MENENQIEEQNLNGHADPVGAEGACAAPELYVYYCENSTPDVIARIHGVHPNITLEELQKAVDDFNQKKEENGCVAHVFIGGTGTALENFAVRNMCKFDQMLAKTQDDLRQAIRILEGSIEE